VKHHLADNANKAAVGARPAGDQPMMTDQFDHDERELIFTATI
jgi:hypothetical protein